MGDIGITSSTTVKDILRDGFPEALGDYLPLAAAAAIAVFAIFLIVAGRRRRKKRWAELTEDEKQAVLAGMELGQGR